MGKTKAKSSKDKGTKGWKSKSGDGKKLVQLLESGAVPPGMGPSALCKAYPQYKKYNRDSFAQQLPQGSLFSSRGRRQATPPESFIASIVP